MSTMNTNELNVAATTENDIEVGAVESPPFSNHPVFWNDNLDASMQTIEAYGPDTPAQEVEISSEYEIVRGQEKPQGRKAYGTQREVCTAWLDMVFPAHNFNGRSAQLYTRSSRRTGWMGRDIVYQINYEGVQYPDGTGDLYHYDTLAAIRTHNGLIINNSQNWATGFAHLVEPRGHERDYVLPLDGIESLLPSGEGLFDIVDVLSDDEKMRKSWNGRYVRSIPYDSPRVVLLNSGNGVVVGYDRTASNRDLATFGFYVTAEEIESFRSISDSLELLKPDIVAAKEQEGFEIYERDGRTDGKRIVRQGEWFLVPVDEDFDDSELRVTKVYSDAMKTRTIGRYTDSPRKVRSLNRNYRDEDLGSHIPRDKGTVLPTVCPDCETSWFEITEDDRVLCQSCDHEFSEVYVRGTFRHIGNDHSVVNLGEHWHIAVTHDRDVMVFDTGAQGGTGGWD